MDWATVHFHLKNETMGQPNKIHEQTEVREMEMDGWMDGMDWSSRMSYQSTPGRDAASNDGILVFPHVN